MKTYNYGEVRNVRQAILAALQKHKKGLTRYQLCYEAAKARWPGPGLDPVTSHPHRQYRSKSVENGIQELIREGLIRIKRKAYSGVYEYNPELAFEETRGYRELKSRLSSCRNRLKGHGFEQVRISHVSPEMWACASDNQRLDYEWVHVHVDDLDLLVSELRRRSSI